MNNTEYDAPAPLRCANMAIRQAEDLVTRAVGHVASEHNPAAAREARRLQGALAELRQAQEHVTQALKLVRVN